MGRRRPRAQATTWATTSADATELARSQESLTSFLHRQALALRLSEVDRAALRFLIESLNDDGYLEDSLEELAAGLAGDDLEQIEELVHRFTVALRLLQPGAHRRGRAQPGRMPDAAAQARLGRRRRAGDATPCRPRCASAQQPMELLARRDIKRLMQLCGDGEAARARRHGLIARLEPKPGRRFVDVERNIIVPDVIVRKPAARRGQPRFSVQLNPDVMPRLRVHDIYAGALRGHKGGGPPGAAAAPAGGALVHQEHPAAL
jgi:RNA polymerase sigma-54 factor